MAQHFAGRNRWRHDHNLEDVIRGELQLSKNRGPGTAGLKIF